LSKIPHVGKVEKVKDGWLLETTDDVDLRKEIAQYAQQNGILPLTLRTEEKTLEEVFKELTK
jgi:ABC-2 type transport system ATP-binding protein